MIRNTFLKTKIPVIPYLVWSRRHSSRYHEAISGDYGKKTVVLSWTTFEPDKGKKANGIVNIFYNDTSKDDQKWYNEIANCDKKEEYINQLSILNKSIK